MANHLYIIKRNGRVAPERSVMKWAIWMGDVKRRIVKQEWVGDSKVSTVFLGVDYNFEPTGGPLLWETMVFNGPLNGTCVRCSGNREQAEAMHERVVARVKAKDSEIGC